jgi:hypothetical protein
MKTAIITGHDSVAVRFLLKKDYHRSKLVKNSTDRPAYCIKDDMRVYLRKEAAQWPRKRPNAGTSRRSLSKMY